MMMKMLSCGLRSQSTWLKVTVLRSTLLVLEPGSRVGSNLRAG
jgi:hypothetical protein